MGRVKGEGHEDRQESDEMTKQEIRSMGGMCAWEDCDETYDGNMPNGWRRLLVFWSQGIILDVREIPQDTWDRDGVLCPEHARELESQLKDLARWFGKPMSGNA